MSTGLTMMLKSLGLDPKMMETVAKAVQSAAQDLHDIKEQNAEILRRLDAHGITALPEALPPIPVTATELIPVNGKG
jgi:hypothetical protein